jgi:hypothetical protein
MGWPRVEKNKSAAFTTQVLPMRYLVDDSMIVAITQYARVDFI